MRKKFSPNRNLIRAVVALSLLDSARPLCSAANLTWDIVSGDASITSGNGTWNASVGNTVWNSVGTNISWSQSSQTNALHAAVFGGATGNYAVTVGANIATQAMTFNSDIFTLSANSLQTISVNNAGSPAIIVAADKTATFGNNLNIYFNSSAATAQVVSMGTGSVLNINSGVTLNKLPSITTGFAEGMLRFTGSGTVNIGGTVTYSSETITGGIILAHASGDSFIYNVNAGGTLSSGSTSIGLVVCNNNNSATVNVYGNLTTTGTSTYAGINMITNNMSGAATINLLAGGTITTCAIRPTYNGSTNTGTSTFNFNGGTLTATIDHSAFMTGLSAVNIKPGGAIIDTNGHNITIGNALLGSGDGALIKNGAGTLTLTSTGSTYTGPTTVNSGKLLTTNALQNQTALSIKNGSAVEITAGGNHNKVTSISSLSLTGAGSRLILHDNDLVINDGAGASSYSSIVNMVKSGLITLGGGGTDGIISTEVDNQVISGTLLAVVDGSAIGGAITTTSGFDIPSPTTSVIVKYTWFGDCNLDGTVDGSDYLLVDTGFASGGTVGGWVFGDFDYNGAIDTSDYILIDTGFSNQASILPEPAALGMLSVGILLLRRGRSTIRS